MAKIIDYFIRLLTVTLFLACFFAPASIVWSLTLLVSFAVGLWGALFPQGILLWAKTAHPDIDETDPSLWWVPRLIGTFFMRFAGAFGLVFLLRP